MPCYCWFCIPLCTEWLQSLFPVPRCPGPETLLQMSKHLPWFLWSLAAWVTTGFRSGGVCLRPLHASHATCKQRLAISVPLERRRAGGLRIPLFLTCEQGWGRIKRFNQHPKPIIADSKGTLEKNLGLGNPIYTLLCRFWPKWPRYTNPTTEIHPLCCNILVLMAKHQQSKMTWLNAGSRCQFYLRSKSKPTLGGFRQWDQDAK